MFSAMPKKRPDVVNRKAKLSWSVYLPLDYSYKFREGGKGGRRDMKLNIANIRIPAQTLQQGHFQNVLVYVLTCMDCK